MCGIAGLWRPNDRPAPQPAEIEPMVAALHHRGPDGNGVHAVGRVALGHARLSIIDLAGGAQPMCNEDGSVWVTFNGEIFNYVELRDLLRARGHRFRTASDTEVLVHLYEEHGDAFVEHLNGQFAIALWDDRRQRLVLARDRVGIRPLFYTWIGGSLAFASEAKALFALPGGRRELNPAALASVFSFWSALPADTAFEGVYSVPPGHLMRVDERGTQMARYWDWPFGGGREAGSDDALAEELHALLVDAVRLQLRADVPVGAYLSGGLDSSVVTALVRNYTQASLRTFSTTFEDAEFDESAYQRQLVAHLRTEHSSILASRTAIGHAFPRTVWHAESPLVRTAATPMMLLADSVRAAGYKVVLTGEGADEAFGGYDLFKEAKIRRWVARCPESRWRARLLGRLYPYLASSPGAGSAMTQRFFSSGLDRVDAPDFAHTLRIAATRRTLHLLSDEWRSRVLAWDPATALAAGLPDDFGRWHALERDQYVEAHTLLSGYLLSSQGDRVAMAASVEARYPFLDHRVVEFSCRLPPRLKLRGLREKVLLKQSMAAELPAAIIGRTKQPYRAPDSASFFHDGQPLPYVADLLSASRLRAAGIFEPTAVARLYDKCRAGKAIGFADNMAFVGVLSTMLVHEQFIRRAGAPARAA
jgi:asparagine synthase (glutamine-hydrolysing)